MRRRQRRLVYRFEGDAEAHLYSADAHTPARLVDASAAGVGLVAEAPLELGSEPAVLLQLADAAWRDARGRRQGRSADLPRGRRQAPDRRDDPRDRPRRQAAPDGVVLRRLHATSACAATGRPGPLPEEEAIVVSLDDYREPGPIPLRPSIPALRQA